MPVFELLLVAFSVHAPHKTLKRCSLLPSKWEHLFSVRSEEHTSELQSLRHVVCRLLLEKKKHNEDNVPVQSLHEEERFIRLRTDDEHVGVSMRMIGSRGETSMVSILREHLSRADGRRSL